MMAWADLHTHSAASDGQYSPADLVCKAQAAGVEVLALTDHDTLSGTEEALCAGKACGIRVVRGIELGASEHRYMHILGLGMSDGGKALPALCDRLQRSRNERKYRMITFLHEKGIDLSLEDVERLAGGRVVARPHFAQVMVQQGYVSCVREAFDRYLDTEEYQKIERFKASAEVCIQAIRADGGKAVLAHPYQLEWDTEKLDRALKTLKTAGLDGLECWYPRHTRQMTEEFLALARKYELFVSAGSDFHGERIKPDIRLQPWNVNVDWLD
ncbi:PHP domain-containing protein [Agathobaculum desmolans]|uniref:PHP domain-containing protein n=1 Tax=Agathobaculum desmolans TaxID=39484 RepID=UPI0004E24F7C|nr:PHP domain-containing protein [Agathobaculum desmolans]